MVTPGEMKNYPAITGLDLREQYHPTKLPQITILDINGVNNAFDSKSLNKGFPKYAFTAIQSQRVGSKPNKKPLRTVGCFTSNAKIIPQMAPHAIKRMAAIIWSAGEFVPNCARYISTNPGSPMPIAIITYMTATKIIAPKAPAVHPFFIWVFI